MGKGEDLPVNSLLERKWLWNGRKDNKRKKKMRKQLNKDVKRKMSVMTGYTSDQVIHFYNVYWSDHFTFLLCFFIIVNELKDDSSSPTPHSQPVHTTLEPPSPQTRGGGANLIGGLGQCFVTLSILSTFPFFYLHKYTLQIKLSTVNY